MQAGALRSWGDGDLDPGGALRMLQVVGHITPAMQQFLGQDLGELAVSRYPPPGSTGLEAPRGPVQKQGSSVGVAV